MCLILGHIPPETAGTKRREKVHIQDAISNVNLANATIFQHSCIPLALGPYGFWDTILLVSAKRNPRFGNLNQCVVGLGQHEAPTRIECVPYPLSRPSSP